MSTVTHKQNVIIIIIHMSLKFVTKIFVANYSTALS
jgi:hypothetical protein